MSRHFSVTPLKRLTFGRAPAWVAIGVVGTIVAALLSAKGYLPWPQCPWRQTTGLPCPSCGCTRSLLAWFHADPGEAFRFNPLFCVACVAGSVWLSAAALAKAFRWRWPGRFRERAREVAARWPVWQFVLVVVALNWLYLFLKLPE